MSHTILHVLSSNFFAGSTAYAINLAEKQSQEGHNVFMVTDVSYSSDQIKCISKPISNRSIKQRIKNILFLIKFIKKNKITIVHAHSRASSWLAYYSTKILRIPLVSTIHGRQVKKSDVYGQNIIGICKNLISHLKTEMQFDPNKIVLIPNGINTSELKTIKRTRNTHETVISVVGRFNGPKGENFSHLVRLVFPSLLKKYPKLHITLNGCEWNSFPEEGKIQYNSLKLKYGNRIQNMGMNLNIFQTMADSDLVIGAGRVAIEALSLNIPVMALGEGCYHGLLDKNNISEAIESNYGDIMPQKSNFVPDCEKILLDLISFLNDKPEKIDLRKEMTIYDVDTVYTQIMNVYRKAVIKKIHPQHIPVLMYHKVPDKEINSKHRVFVTKSRFKKHLRFYAFRRLKAITFRDYEDFALSKRPKSEFPKKPFIITFDDGYADNINNVLPLTEKYGFKGVLYLLGDFSINHNIWDKDENIQFNRLMTKEEKAEFVRCGWEIGAHTLSHPDLTKLTKEEVKSEVINSKINIEKNLQTKIISFAYPFGNLNDRIKEIIKEANFTYGIATDSGGLTIEEDRFEIFRVNIFPEDGFFQLYKKTSNWYRLYYKRKRGH